MQKLLPLYQHYQSLVSKGILNYEKFNQYTLVHHSNAVEGSTLTLEETFLLLDEKLTPKNKPLEHSLMATDHLQALQYTLELARKRTPLQINHIQQMGALVMQHTGGKISSMGGDFDSSQGDFRKCSVSAGSTLFMDYQKVAEKTQELLDYINQHISTVKGLTAVNELAFDAHYQLVTIHPFADGNGRCSRLLMNYVQHYHQLPLSIIYLEDKQAYFEALIETRKQKEVGIFRTFMFSQLEKQLKHEIEKLTRPPLSDKEKGFSFLF
jgi:Fic family protein